VRVDKFIFERERHVMKIKKNAFTSTKLRKIS